MRRISEVNENSVVLLLGGVVFPLLPFFAVVLFSVVFPSCVVFFSPPPFGVWVPSLRLLAVLLPFSAGLELNTLNKLKLSHIRRSESEVINVLGFLLHFVCTHTLCTSYTLSCFTQGANSL